MKEELIRVQHGIVQSKGNEYCFDIEIFRGECIGIYVDEHITAGTAYLDIFKGYTQMKSGKAFVLGNRVGMMQLRQWVLQNSMVFDKNRFDSRELTVWDFVMSLCKSVHWKTRRQMQQRLYAQSVTVNTMQQQMGLCVAWEQKLKDISLLEYYCLCVFCAWFWQSELLILERFTEIFRWEYLDKLMHAVQVLQQQGTAVLLCDMDEKFLFRYANRIDVVKNCKTYYHLYPDEYDERIYEIMGWKQRYKRKTQNHKYDKRVMVVASELQFHAIKPLSFQICSGEIVFLRDENAHIATHIKDCFLGTQGWQQGRFYLDGKQYQYQELAKTIGRIVAIQLERPDRAGGVLFDNMTALDNLIVNLLPKAGWQVIQKKIADHILYEASQWFPKEALQRSLGTWTLPERLRFSYYKWLVLNPKLLICFFPFAGQESAHHEMILEMLVACARRGMAIWLISSGIDSICEKTQNKEFLYRLRDMNG